MGKSSVCMTHWDGFYNTFSNVYAGPNTQVIRFRSRHLTVDGFTADSVGTTEFAHAQRPAHCLAINGSGINYNSGDNETVFWFGLESSTSRFGNDYGEDLVYENIDLEQHGSSSIEEIGTFSDDATIDGLTFRNITYGGQQLTRSHVEQGVNYDSSRITNLTVE